MLIDTYKDGYSPEKVFLERDGRSECGDGNQLSYDAKLTSDGVDMAGAYWEHFTNTYRLLASRHGYSVLDFGCGYGRCANFLTMFDCARYVGCEPSAYRRSYAAIHEAGHARAFIASLDQLTHGDTFDVIWVCTVLSHLSRPLKLTLCRQLAARLAPGGVMILCEGGIVEGTEAEAEALYRSPKTPPHIVPIPIGDVRDACDPMPVIRLTDRIVLVNK